MDEIATGMWWTPSGLVRAVITERDDFKSHSYGSQEFAELTVWMFAAMDGFPAYREVSQWVGERSLNSIFVADCDWEEFSIVRLPDLIRWAEELSLTMMRSEREEKARQ